MYAVIDIGSNTIRLVLYKIIDGQLKQTLNNKEAAGLVGYVEDGRLSQKGIEKAVNVLKNFMLILESVQTEDIFVFATASLRNIKNTSEVLAQLKQACGVDVRVLSGDEEAVFDYFGAIKELDAEGGLMVDVGGGSTELVFFAEREVMATYSLPIGSLNMFNQFVSDIIPTKHELRAIGDYSASLLEKIQLPIDTLPTASLCGVGGTARAACKLNDELLNTNLGYSGFECSRLRKILKLLKHDREKLVSSIIKTSPDRLHTILPGLAILNAVSEHYGCSSFSASPYGVREGYLIYMLEGGGCNA